MPYSSLNAWLRGPEWVAVLDADGDYSAALRAAFGKRACDERYVRDDSHHPQAVRDARRKLQTALVAAEMTRPNI